MPRTMRQFWGSRQGRTSLNFNWDAIDFDSVVLIVASEYSFKEGPGSPIGVRFVGLADFIVSSVVPHGPPYDPNHGVTFVVDVNWGSPVDLVTDIIVLDNKPEQTLYQ